MKAVVCLAFLAISVAAVQADDYEFPCPKKSRPGGDSGCSYYCQRNGEWKLGKYQNNVPCDYQGRNDGVCKEGLCHSKDTGSQNQGGSTNQEHENEDDEEWDRK